MKKKKLSAAIPLLTAFVVAVPAVLAGCENTIVPQDDTIVVKFDYNDGVSRTKLVFTKDGQVEEPEAPENRGHVFKCWTLSKDGGAEVEFPYTVNDETTFYAQWEAETCSFTFDWNCDGVSGVTLEKKYGETVTESDIPDTIPEYRNMVFRYWQYKADGGKQVSFPYEVKGDTVVYAYWISGDIKLYEVKFDANYDNAGKIDSQTVEEGKTVALPTNLRRSGWQFGGWSETKGGTTPLASPYAPSGDITLYAIWKKKSFSISFKTNYVGAKEEVHESLSVESGSAIEKEMLQKPDPERTGFKFLGWFTNESGGTQITFPCTVERSTSFFAHWKSDPVTETVFDAEFIEIDPALNLPNYSGSYTGYGLIITDSTGGEGYGAKTKHREGSGKTSNHYLIGYYAPGATITFVINSSKAVSGAKLYGTFALEKDFGKSAKFAPSGETAESGYGFTILVNGKELDYGSFTAGNKFTESALGDIDLVEGENIIEFTTNNEMVISAAQAMAPCVDSIRIDASGAELTWSPEYDNLDKI